jgi:hypothetical protein
VPPDKLKDVQLRASDLNGDGVVDGTDIAGVIAAFGQCSPDQPCPADITGDGTVGQADLAIVAGNMGAADPAAGGLAPYKLEIGYVSNAPANLLKDVPRIDLPGGGWTMRLELHSPQAKGLRVQLADLATSGLELRVYDPDGSTVLGPFVRPRVSEDGTWWTPTIFGQTIGLELTLPPEAPSPARTPRITAG